MEQDTHLGRVLLVEDEPAHVELVQAAFERSRFCVELVAAPTVGEALRRLADERFDLVIADWRLPDGDALGLLESCVPAPDLPFIVMTSHGDERLAVSLMRAGATDYVVKSSESLRDMPHVAARALREARQLGELQQARQELRRTEASLAAIVEHVPDIIYRLDPAGRITFISNAVRRYGHEPEELLGRSVFDLVHPADRSLANHCINERRTGERATRLLELRLVTGEAATRTFEVHAADLSDEPVFLLEAHGVYGTPSPASDAFLGTQGIARDITDRKRAEREIARLAAAVRSTADAVAVLTATHVLQYGNPALHHLAARLPDAEKGAAALAARLAAVCDGGNGTGAAGEVNARQGRARVVGANGRVLWLDVSLSDLPPEAGTTPLLVLVARDVTAAIELEQRLHQATKLEAIGTLAGGIAHDFNNALAGIMGHAELAALEIQPESDVGHSLDQILVSCHRAADLTRQILTFARRGDATVGLVQPSLVLKEAMQLLRPSLPLTVDVQLAVDHDAGSILGDPSQVHQVVINLVTNAYQSLADERGGVAISVGNVWLESPIAAELGLRLPAGEYVRLAVSDTGRGMDPQVRERIFEPFFTTKPVGQGTGMGLSVVHGIVTAQGGDIVVTSSPDCGSRFEVYWPRVADLQPAAPAGAVPETPKRTDRLLLVDDESLVLNSVARLLRLHGCDVTAVPAAREALELVRQDPCQFDAVLLDHMMPVMTGTQLLAAFRLAGCSAPAILVTGYVGPGVTDDEPPPGFSAVLTKPVRLRELVGALDSLLG